METTTMTATTHPCPECDASLPIAPDVMQGEILACDDCGSELEVLETSPMALELAPDVQEDWGE